MTKQYYIEFKSKNSPNPYDMQSKWFNSEKQAIKLLKSLFDFIDDYQINVYLMSATFDENGNIIGDIEQERKLL